MGSVVDRLAELFRQARMAGWDDEAVARQVLDALWLNDSGYPVQPPDEVVGDMNE